MLLSCLQVWPAYSATVQPKEKGRNVFCQLFPHYVITMLYPPNSYFWNELCYPPSSCFHQYNINVHNMTISVFSENVSPWHKGLRSPPGRGLATLCTGSPSRSTTVRWSRTPTATKKCFNWSKSFQESLKKIFQKQGIQRLFKTFSLSTVMMISMLSHHSQ